MGSGISRPGERHPKATKVKRRLSSLICGSSSSRATAETEDYPVEPLVNPAGFSHTVPGSSQPQPKVSLLSTEGIGFTNPKPERGCLSESGSLSNKDPLFDGAQNNIESARKQKYLREVGESTLAHNHSKESKFSQPGHGDTTSTSESSRDGDSDKFLTNDAEELANNGPRRSSTGVLSPVRMSRQELRSPHLERTGIEGHNTEGIRMVHSSSVASSVVSSSNIGSQSVEDDNIHEVIPSGLRFLTSDRIQGSGEGNLFHVDVLSISSSNLSGSNNTINTREARQNSRGMLWDAFSSRSSRSQTDISTLLFAMDDDGVDSRRSWLLDYGSDIFNDGMSDDIWHLGRRSHFASERRWHSRSEFRGRLRGGTSERGGGTICPSGLHPDGSCFCGLEDDSSSQSSMSRIVMLAEALFEVLDELHRQPTSFALSMLSNPAPEPTVDSLPVKSYEKSTAVESGEDVEQCYICLEEYETDDKIRVLPCAHEYHMACVDKWLKEIHGVCPLCRGDVRQPTAEGSFPDSDVSSVPVNLV